MSGIRLETLVRAEVAMMRVWNLRESDGPPSYDIKKECMEAAVAIRAQLQMLGMTVEVKADAPTEKVAA